MDRICEIEAQVRGSESLPEVLAAAFDAFEAIRAAARDCEDRTPELFAAFLLAGGAATEGRNALLGAPSLPHGGGPRGGVVAAADVYGAADELAALAAALAARMSAARSDTAAAEDRAACGNAASAAIEIHRLLARADDETTVR